MEIRLGGRLLSALPGEYFLSESVNEAFAWTLRKRILQAGEHAPHVTRRHLPITERDILRKCGLNELQLRGIENILSHNFNGAIQGPPGTGKTQTLCALLEVALASGLKVGLTAFTHTAVDNALGRILEKHPSLHCVRIGDEMKIAPQIAAAGANVSPSFADSAFEEDLNGTEWQLIAATSHAWAFSKLLPWVDVLLVDEAGQIPSFMLPCLSLRANSLVCLGDHKQLPPILQAARPGQSLDLFSEVLSQLGDRPVMLEEQYRMNERLQEWSSQAYYEGRLRAGLRNRHRDVLESSPLFRDSDKVSLTCYSGNEHERRQAELVLEEVDKALRSGLPLNEIGIITPHRNQASAINQKIQETYGVAATQELSADTVERYQGQEREYVILGLSTFREISSFESSAFVSQAHRLNVAATRAKSRMSVISNMSVDTPGIHSYAGAFLNWAGSKTLRRVSGPRFSKAS